MESTRDRQKARRRSDILHAASMQFAARGYHGTTISSIAAEMNAPKSAVGYHQFTTKEAIALAIVDDQRARWHTLIEQISAGPGTGLERFLSILLSAALDARANPLAAAAARLMVEQRSAGITLPPSTFRWRAVGSDLIQLSLTGGDLPSRRSADDIVGTILTTSYGVFSAENNGFEEQQTADNLRALWRDLLVALGVPDADEVVARVRTVEIAEPE